MVNKKIPERITYVYISFFQKNSAGGEMKQMKFRLSSLSFLKFQLQKEDNNVENAKL